MFLSPVDGATPDNVDWARRKSNTVAHFRRSSYAIGLKMQQAGGTLADKHGLPVRNRLAWRRVSVDRGDAGVIGSITVSGCRSVPITNWWWKRCARISATTTASSRLQRPEPMRLPPYALLGIAIVAEVIATSAMRASEGFSRFLPSTVVVVGYGVAFYCLSLTL